LSANPDVFLRQRAGDLRRRDLISLIGAGLAGAATPRFARAQPVTPQSII
jgi:hypothetical protein